MLRARDMESLASVSDTSASPESPTAGAARVTARELIERLAPERVPLNIALQVVLGAGEQLVEAHGRVGGAVVHGGLEPGRILLEPNGEVRLVGFAEAYSARRRLAYQAPELRRGERPDVLADVYALGAVLYELCTGFNLLQALTRAPCAAEEPAPRPSRFNPAIDDALDEAILSALAKDPIERPYSVKVFLQPIRSYLEELGVEASAEELREYLHQSFPWLRLTSAPAAPKPPVTAPAPAPRAPVAVKPPSPAAQPAPRASEPVVRARYDHEAYDDTDATFDEDADTGTAPLWKQTRWVWTRDLELKLKQAWGQKRVRVGTAVVAGLLLFVLALPSHRNVQLTSTPPGATVVLDGRTVGVTPMKLKSLTRDTHTVELSLPGHKKERVELDLAKRDDDQLAVELEADVPRSQPGRWVVKPTAETEDLIRRKGKVVASSKTRR